MVVARQVASAISVNTSRKGIRVVKGPESEAPDDLNGDRCCVAVYRFVLYDIEREYKMHIDYEWSVRTCHIWSEENRQTHILFFPSIYYQLRFAVWRTPPVLATSRMILEGKIGPLRECIDGRAS
jgi:hypothetical protein